ncbi:MAG: ribulose-phosphate 3-epimerase [Flavobacteriia bacterium]|jgi:ribulose-phosphate 3-epimerase|nr:ribulose-phosphate 3-epimerase [Flavobacteriia bacterium]
MIVSPSLLSCDFGNLQRDVEMLNQSAAQWIHIDVMDGVFVPNISFGFPILKAVRKHTSKVLDVHLMIQNPDPYLEEFKLAGADILTVHYEACTHLHRTVQKIKSLGMKAGVAINPHTPVSVLKHLMNEIDLVLVMSVNPGFGGQSFISDSFSKVTELKQLIMELGLPLIIEVDGGVNLENAMLLVGAGADAVVAGNFVFNSENPVDAIEALSKVE